MSKLPVMWSVICDDVRKEVGNKLSYMGIYSGSIVVTQFPARLPKLCFVLNLRVDAESPLRQAVFRIMKDETVIARAELKEEQLSEMQIRIAAAAKDVMTLESPHFTFSVVCEVAPFEVTESCKLRMRADTEHGEIKGGTIPVVQGVVEAQ